MSLIKHARSDSGGAVLSFLGGAVCQLAAGELGGAQQGGAALPFPWPGSPLDLLPFSGAVGREERNMQVVNVHGRHLGR